MGAFVFVSSSISVWNRLVTQSSSIVDLLWWLLHSRPYLAFSADELRMANDEWQFRGVSRVDLVYYKMRSLYITSRTMYFGSNWHGDPFYEYEKKPGRRTPIEISVHESHYKGCESLTPPSATAHIWPFSPLRSGFLARSLCSTPTSSVKREYDECCATLLGNNRWR